MNQRCVKKGHKFKGVEGAYLPYTFCSRWRCEVSAVSKWVDPKVAIDLHNAIPREKRYPRFELAPNGTILEEF